jgi:hypothetical protein
VNINTVENGTRYPFLIFGDNSRGTGAGFLLVAIKSARAGGYAIGKFLIEIYRE